MLIVDSGRGCFYQRCFDADCRAARFSSNEFPLPAALIRAVLAAAAPSGTSALDDASSSSDLSMRDTDEEWSQETLASIDEFLQASKYFCTGKPSTFVLVKQVLLY